eukprot:NODE_641_length_1737_cov_69.587578_g631_i0.p1 GENE.NODE_641_length_1737_cov_69.587578_g631_i0~~NODE_641_length_1737_cov_69.587578_g631_i0.p1  ORF type:complete len:173 (+),score=11.11 NODE_641_length_1737_cov_69.587578_g631_i0:64-582(+)
MGGDMSKGKKGRDPFAIHSAAYDLDLSGVRRHMEFYKRSENKTNESRNPANYYGLADGKGIFFTEQQGNLDLPTLAKLLKHYGCNPDMVSEIAGEIDPSSSGSVSYDLFMTWFEENLHLMHLAHRDHKNRPTLTQSQRNLLRQVFEESSIRHTSLNPTRVNQAFPIGTRSGW